MRNAITSFILCLYASLLLNMSGIDMADAMPVNDPSERNFIFYVDISGSMGLSYHERSTSRIEVALALLHALNEEMPDNEANFGVYTFGPHHEYLRVAPFDRDALTRAINQIPTEFKFTGRPTPMAVGILNLDTMIEALPGTVTFVAITDGESNFGPPPDEAIQSVYDRYLDRVCFHFISFAKKSSEKAFIENLSELNSCSIVAEAVDLLDESVRADFIKDVFGQ